MLILGAGCTYYNSIYNAEHLFAEAERHRRAGRDSLAAALYADVIRKAAHGFRREPDGGWAYEAAFLLGRAHLRTGDLPAARAALEHSAGLAEDPEERLAAHVYLGVVEAELGRPDRATGLFNEALAGVTMPAARAEGHLHRARILLARGNPDAGWWDLDRAAEGHPDLRVEATLERMRSGIRLDDRRRTEESVRRLLSYPEAGERAGALIEALGEARDRWGAGAAADLLEDAEAAAWSRTPRDRLALERSGLLRQAGRTAEAELLLREVSDGPGATAAAARVRLARWMLEGADDVGDVYALRGLLLPAGGDPGVAALLGDIGLFEELVFDGVDAPLAWFAAAELARDALGAKRLARDLMIAYAGNAPAEPWAPKALLAAIELSDTELERARLRERLEAHAGSPYVLAAHGRPAVGYEALEEELVGRLREIHPR